MIQLFARLFLKNYDDYSDPAVRRGYGMLCSITGICLNFLQSLAKLIAGAVAGSVAIMADGINNLSDAASSIVTLWGFHKSGQEPDEDHPFGHGRSEYVAGVVVAILVMVIGVEILKESIGKMIHPEPVYPSLLSFIILGGSVLLKLYMFGYNRIYGNKIDSPTLRAVAIDSISDVFVTFVVILAMVLSKFTTLNVDAYGGFLVGLFVLYMGFDSLKDTVAPLLGQKAEPEFVEQVKEIVTRQPDLSEPHHIVVHDYGNGNRFVTLDVEVPGEMDLFSIHDEVDYAEHMLRKELGCKAAIHVDPYMPQTEELAAVTKVIEGVLRDNLETYDLKDVRIIPQEPKAKVIYEVYVPLELDSSEADLRQELKAKSEAALPDYSVRVTVDHPYV